MTRPSQEQDRAARYKRGLRAEWVAVVCLLLRGYRILFMRYKTPVGEIDLIARRGRRIAFVEVKRRTSLDAALRSITPTLRQRVQNAAELWRRRHAPHFSGEIGFDVVVLAPSARFRVLRPHYLKDAFDHRKTP